ncbi:MAG: hypothetical protein ACK4UY_11630 [Dietzia sp.]
MSYDLAVYANRLASAEELDELIAQRNGLAIDVSGDQSLTVVRGIRRRYSFTVDGPDLAEPEDIPSEVAAVLLGPKYLYSVLVEGSAASEIPHAVRFARRLARATDGAVVDLQTDDVWTRSHSREIHRPARRERVATVDVAWYCLREELVPDAASTFIGAAQGILPEALPRRFGEYEPLQGKLAQTGADGFINAWRDATSLLFTSGSGICTDGALSAGPGDQHPNEFWSMSLTFLADPIRELAWREALRALFVRIADDLPAFYASAELTTGHIWSGRSLCGDAETEWRTNPVSYREGWTGLPPRPAWWTWLGEPFAQYCSAIPSDRTTMTQRGLLYAAADEPSGPTGLVPLSTWLPEDLFSRMGPNPHRERPAPVVAAKTIPTRLQFPHT